MDGYLIEQKPKQMRNGRFLRFGLAIVLLLILGGVMLAFPRTTTPKIDSQLADTEPRFRALAEMALVS